MSRRVVVLLVGSLVGVPAVTRHADARAAVRTLTYKGDALLVQALIFLNPDLVVQAVRVIREMDHDGSLLKPSEAAATDDRGAP